MTAEAVEEATAPPSSIVVGDDGRVRCRWAGSDPEYARYHDEEWGTPLHGDQGLFEKLSLEAFQSGLSWITILKRRPAFRTAFHGFDIDRVADIDDAEVESLLLDTGIIRNRAKILATRANARVVRDLVRGQPGALDELMWSFAPAAHARPQSFAQIPAVTPESTAMAKHLKGLGMKFVGPTTLYALMQSGGMVDDHVVGCWRG